MGYTIEDQKSFTIKPAIIEGIKLLASRTGYTGEDGFELLVEMNILNSCGIRF